MFYSYNTEFIAAQFHMGPPNLVCLTWVGPCMPPTLHLSYQWTQILHNKIGLIKHIMLTKDVQYSSPSTWDQSWVGVPQGGTPPAYPLLLTYLSISLKLTPYSLTLLIYICWIQVSRRSLNDWIQFLYAPSSILPALMRSSTAQMATNAPEIFVASL